MISNNLIKSIITGIVVIFCLSLYSCSNDRAEEIARFKSEYRDPRLIGKWINLDDKSMIYLLKNNGEFVSIHKTNKYTSKTIEYFYTKDDNFYILTPGDGIKISLSIEECKYKLSKDTLTFKGKQMLFILKY